MNDPFVTKAECAGDQIVRGPLRKSVSGGHLQAGGLSPLSFAYFSLRRQRKVGAAPHRGNANKPIRKQGEANAVGNQTKPNKHRRQKTSAPL
jgi:general secretion pathway protein K